MHYTGIVLLVVNYLYSSSFLLSVRHFACGDPPVEHSGRNIVSYLASKRCVLMAAKAQVIRILKMDL